MIIVSGFSRSREVDMAQSLGAGRYIRKPYMLTELGIAVREELAR